MSDERQHQLLLRAEALRRHLLLLVALVVMLVTKPLLARTSIVVAGLSEIVFGGLYLGIFLSLCQTRWERHTGLLLCIPVVVSSLAVFWLPGHHDVAAAAFHTARLLFLGFTVVVIVRLLTRAMVIRGDDVLGAMCGYMLAAIAWSHVYAIAYLFFPGAFGVNPAIATQLADWRVQGSMFDYLSFTTLTSIGYSDITPVGPPMYSLTWIETIFGQFYMAVVVAQLVGLRLAQAIKGERR